MGDTLPLQSELLDQQLAQSGWNVEDLTQVAVAPNTKMNGSTTSVTLSKKMADTYRLATIRLTNQWVEVLAASDHLVEILKKDPGHHGPAIAAHLLAEICRPNRTPLVG